MGRMQGRIALVTGAARGIGRASAEALAREGAQVMMTDLDGTEGERAAAAVAKAGGSAAFLAHDVTDEAAWAGVVAATRARFGALHVLVNNAGIAILAPVDQMSLADFRRQHAVNVEGVFLGIKHALPAIRASGGGSIVNISSVAGMMGAPNLSAYCSSKGAVRLLTKAVAMECAAQRDGVRVNSVHPGIIDTDIWLAFGAEGAGGSNRPDLDEMTAVSTPLGVKGYPADIGEAVLYLASEESRYVTGAELVVDGGMTAR